MHGGLAGRIENNVDRAASVLFGAAAGFAAYEWLSLSAPRWQATALAAAVALVLSFLCNRIARAIAVRNHIFSVRAFDVRELEPFEPDELTLTEADQLVSGTEEPLVLDDILAEIGPDSRVVRLFDRQTMPTPGELKSRVDDHLRGGSAPAAPDASQALLDALAELRRALR
jgi:hypothetical protein